MKRNFFGKKAWAVAVAALVLGGFASCRKVLDVESKDNVSGVNAYRNVYDADAAVLGIYGKVMNLAKQYVLWNELRGDLMDITVNADQQLKQLNEHAVTADNTYISPRPFYEVILNCNDVLKNFALMKDQSKLKVDEYNQRFSDVAAIRTWVYLQLGIHFGKVPYVTSPLEQVSDLANPSNFNQLELRPLIDTLVRTMEALPYLNNYANTTLLTTIDGHPTQYMFVNKNMLLGDLYLWQGQYNKAARAFRKVMDIQGQSGNTEAFYSQYKLSSFASAAGTISYSRAGDPSSLVYSDGWRYFFERGYDDPYRFEWIWTLPFDAKFAPTNPFIDLMSPIGGHYQVRPAQQAIDYWNGQVQTVLTSNQPVLGMNFDARANFTYRTISGQPVIMKYLYNYLGSTNVPVNVLQENGKWWLARAATLILRFSEAANRDGQYKLAYAFVNRGIRDAYDSAQVSPLLPDSIGRNFKAYVQSRDVTNVQNTLNNPDSTYKFDARQGDGPSYRASWYRSAGIRGRANLFAVKLPGANMGNYLNNLNASNMTAIEDMIIQENALELAYEGQRWADLLRIAIRRDDPSFLADKVYNKVGSPGTELEFAL